MLRSIGKFFWRFMVIFSFIVNVVLVVVLLVLGILIFEIKNNVADPLVQGLHRTAVGLNEATIDWTIPVRDSLGIDLKVPINAGTILSTVTEYNGQPVAPIPGETLVRLTRSVPIVINNALIQSPDLTLRNATVNITLPEGTVLPVALNLEVGLKTEIPVSLDVRAVIPIKETQLTDPIQTLQLLFEPLALGLHNLPGDFNEAGGMITRVFEGKPIDLLATDGTGGINDQAYTGWYGYSMTAGLNYPLANEPAPPQNVPQATGLEPLGGIPILDENLAWRRDLYTDDNTPLQNNINQMNNLIAQGVLPENTWNGDGVIGPLVPAQPTSQASAQNVQGTDNVNVGGTNSSSSGIIPTPASGG